MTLLTGCTSTCGSFKRTQLLLVCMQARFGLTHSYDREKKWTIFFTKMAGDDAQEDSDGQVHSLFMVRHV